MRLARLGVRISTMTISDRMGSSCRGPLSLVGSSPGPGSYSLKERLGEAPKYAMRPRTAVVTKNAMPGPGQYTPSKAPVLGRPPSAVMGSQSRGKDFTTVKTVPGPGTYLPPTPQGRRGPAYSFGAAKAAYKQVMGPGPGAYRVPCTFAAVPRYLIADRPAEFEFV